MPLLTELKKQTVFNFLNKPLFSARTGRLLISDGYYFGGARSKGFATFRNVSKLPFFDKIGQAKSVGFRFYSAI